MFRHSGNSDRNRDAISCESYSEAEVATRATGNIVSCDCERVKCVTVDSQMSNRKVSV